MQIVIVTGAAGGIGRVYAKALAESGYGVVAADLGAGADDVAGEISAAGGAALAVKVDVSDRARRKPWPRRRCSVSAASTVW